MTALLPLLLAGAAAGQPGLLDGFESTAPWSARASDGVSSKIEPVEGTTGRALRLDYDFHNVSGYAYARRELPVTFPANYRLSFKIRGSGGVNDLQLKFVDASGENVWWTVLKDFRPSGGWQTITVPARKMSFAWGPAKDRTLRKTASIELVVVRGRDGGAGSIAIDDLTLTPLPDSDTPAPAARATAPQIVDGNPATVWKARGGQSATVDFGALRELGGVVLDWAPSAGAPAYAIAASDDGRVWRTLRTVREGNGGSDPIALPETITRYIRISLPKGAQPARLAELSVKPIAWGTTPNAMIEALATQAPRGTYPRGFSGQQSYWTLVATDGGKASGLIDEDGRIEVAKGGFSIEPFLIVDGKRIDWAQVSATPSLEQGYLPLPHVLWTVPGLTLDTSLFADKSATSPRLMARYRVTNSGTTARTLRLALAVRPFQVNPPAQFLSQQGGVSRIGAIEWNGRALAVTSAPEIEGDPASTRLVQPLSAPDRVTMASFDAGGVLPRLGADTPSVDHVDDATGLASAALLYDLTLAPGESADIPVVIPAAGGASFVDRQAFDAAHAATVAAWTQKLGAVTITVPPAHQEIADTLRSSLAHILMSRDGAMLKPGTRSYNRSWIRDGAMISDGLLRMGRPEVAADYADWYSNHLFDNGKVPCCVDFRGADPVPENDSNGEYIYLLTQLYRFTGDRARLEREWPRMLAAERYMETQRLSERTSANQAPGMTMRYGLMPPSISHEGYSAKPQYSLWDDFWALRGYKDAAEVAQILGKPEAAGIAASRDQFAADIHAAIGASARHFDIDYIPGATSLGDLDPTSTTIALSPGGEQARLDPVQLANTFERYWERFTARRDGRVAWADYTPYEIRNVSAFVRLGWRKRAQALLDYFLADRRPAAWNGWAEVVGRDPREIRFIGDMPHAWISSDYIRAALDLFAYARADDAAMVLGGGLTPDYLTGKGARIAGLHTEAGRLDFTIRADDKRLVADIAGDARPAGGFVLTWPFEQKPGRAWVDGRPARFGPDGLHIAATGAPIHIEVHRRPEE